MYTGSNEIFDNNMSNICHPYPTVMALDTVIPYLKKIQKTYKSRDTASF